MRGKIVSLKTFATEVRKVGYIVYNGVAKPISCWSRILYIQTLKEPQHKKLFSRLLIKKMLLNCNHPQISTFCPKFIVFSKNIKKKGLYLESVSYLPILVLKS